MMGIDTKLASSFASNKQNREFYSAMPVDYFKMVVAQTGLEGCSDIINITSYVQKANSILDVGAGYGRCISPIFNINPTVDYTAVERNKPFLERLLDDYLPRYQFNYFFGDIFDFDTTKKFDLIILMFSTMSEFNYDEQDALLAKLSTLLSENGLICIDLVELDTYHPVGDVSEGYIDVKTPYGCNHFYILDDEELNAMARSARLKLVTKMKYNVLNNMDRRIFIFTHS